MDSIVEYKYGLAPTNNPCYESIIWEEGPNRTLYLPEVN